MAGSARPAGDPGILPRNSAQSGPRTDRPSQRDRDGRRRRSPRILRGIRRRGGAGRDQLVPARRWRVADDAPSGRPDRRAGRGTGFAAVVAAVELAAAKPGRTPQPPCTNPPPVSYTHLTLPTKRIV